MGQLNSIDLPEPRAHGATTAAPSKRRWWLGVLVLGFIAFGVWYYVNSRNTSQAATAAAPGAAAKGKGVSGAGRFVVPVVVSTAHRGDLPVYFNCLVTVTPFYNVTVRSRAHSQFA